MSDWQQHDIEGKVRQILSEAPMPAQEHHFGKPFFTAYQLAIAFDEKYPDVVAKLGYQLGGQGTGEPVSLAQYLARELSRRIKSGEIKGIEGGFISNYHLADILFDHKGKQVKSSLTGTQYNLSMFRLTT